MNGATKADPQEERETDDGTTPPDDGPSEVAGCLLALFAGSQRAHGVSTPPVEEDTKAKRKGEARTIRRAPGVEEWQRHLAGEAVLGIVPIMDDGTTWWGAIDIDAYEDGVCGKVKDRVAQLQLPLVPCRSKSGGVHAFVFFSEPVPATLVRKRLAEFAASVGYEGAEIFPKQDAVDPSKGEVGNYIFMPYFGTPTIQHGWTREGKSLATVADFVAYAEGQRITGDELEAVVVPDADQVPATVGAAPFADGPPCLQTLAERGIEEGSRNNVVFQAAVYFKKKHEEDWQDKVVEFNSGLDDPLPVRELNHTVIRSVDRRDYGFKCNEQPMCSVCDRAACLRRAFGIGGGDDEFTELIKIQPVLSVQNVDQVRYRLKVRGHAIELPSPEALMNFHKLRVATLAQANILIHPRRADEWERIVERLLDGMTIVNDEHTTGDEIWEAIIAYIESSNDGDQAWDLLNGRALMKRDEVVFAVTSVNRYVHARFGRAIKSGDVARVLEAKGGRCKATRIRGKGVRLWRVPRDAVDGLLETDDTRPAIEFDDLPF